MALNIKIKYSETAEASAVNPMVIEVINDDSLPLAFKLNTKNPHRYVTNASHGFVQPKKSKSIMFRLRPPYELREAASEHHHANNIQREPISILKGSQRTNSPSSGSGGPSSSSGGRRNVVPLDLSGASTVEAAEIIRVEIRVVTGVVSDQASEADFQKYWSTAFHHSIHMVPCKAVFLSDNEYFGTLLTKQEASLKAAEAERADWQRKVDEAKQKKNFIDERNGQFAKDLELLRKRASQVSSSSRKIVVPLWVAVTAIAAAAISALTS